MLRGALTALLLGAAAGPSLPQNTTWLNATVEVAAHGGSKGTFHRS